MGPQKCIKLNTTDWKTSGKRLSEAWQEESAVGGQVKAALEDKQFVCYQCRRENSSSLYWKEIKSNNSLFCTPWVNLLNARKAEKLLRADVCLIFTCTHLNCVNDMVLFRTYAHFHVALVWETMPSSFSSAKLALSIKDNAPLSLWVALWFQKRMRKSYLALYFAVVAVVQVFSFKTNSNG